MLWQEDLFLLKENHGCRRSRVRFSHHPLFFAKKCTGTRTQNLLLRRQAPYPLGHTDINKINMDWLASHPCHSSLGVEHSLSKRKVVGSNPACGSQFFLTPCFCWPEARGRARFSGWTARQSYSCVGPAQWGCSSVSVRFLLSWKTSPT